MKVVILNESTGWTLSLRRADGSEVSRFYVSGRHHGSPYPQAKEIAAQYGANVVNGGNSPDYDREMAAIAADPYFMS